MNTFSTLESAVGKESNPIAIHVDDVSKRFKLYHSLATGPLKELLFFWKRKKYYKEFFAVSNATLTIRKGEVVGIIGANGAGKTTLLKMIAGLLPVDFGSVLIKGKVTALLALGVGVHPEFTGRENIYYGGMLLGMSKAEVLRKTQSIIEFAELGEHIDYPFRTYSSGMKARLLFAISMSIDPDILIVDEALATGDAGFVSKSSGRIRALCDSGATVMIVSHNLRQIEELCRRCIVMEKGRIVFDGPTTEAVSHYIEQIYRTRDGKSSLISDSASRERGMRGTGDISIANMYFTSDGKREARLVVGKPCEMHIEVDVKRDLESVAVCVELFSEKSPTAFAFIPPCGPMVQHENASPFPLTHGKHEIIFRFASLVLGDGLYWCSVELYPGKKDYFFSYDTCYCYYSRFTSFHAIYEERSMFGRGTLTEIPLRSLEVKQL